MGNEVKEISIDELKEVVKGQVLETLPELKAAIAEEMKGANRGEASFEEKMASAAAFIVKVVNKDPELKAIDTTTGSAGYAIPTDLAAAIVEKRDKIAKIRGLAFVFAAAGNIQIPYEGTGVTAYWVGDNASVTESNPTIAKKDLVDNYLACRVLVPRKLLNGSAYNLINYITSLSSRSIVSTEETAFVAGDGSAKPTGIRTATITSQDQASTAFAYGDLVDLYFNLPEQYRRNAAFLTSSKGMKIIRKLVDLNGVPIFDTNTQTIFGRPVVETADIPANLGTGTDETEIYFGDFEYYWIKDGEQMFVESQSKIATLQVELVIAEAVDGVLINGDAFRKCVKIK